MANILGLKGLKPNKNLAHFITSPPYDVIKKGSSLENLLQQNENSLYHITLGNESLETLERYIKEDILEKEKEACFYVYQQSWQGKTRIGFLSAVQVDDYKNKTIIRHEKTFDDKVKGRIALAQKTSYTIEPIFLLTQSQIQPILEKVTQTYQPIYDFKSDFQKLNDLDGIHNKIFRIEEFSTEGQQLKESIAKNPLYIADGHHRYHAALKNNQTHTLAYIVEKAEIQAYNRVINGKYKFESIKKHFDLIPCPSFSTPTKNEFCIYSKQGCYLLKAKDLGRDIVSSLDCSILEKELYPHLGISHSMILDQKYFDYYPESDLEIMKQQVDEGNYDIAVALHPISIQELISVADAGLENSDIVMPEKSTFFAPKVLSGLFLYKHTLKNQ